jgi:hypothetical protein
LHFISVIGASVFPLSVLGPLVDIPSSVI